MLKEDVGAPTLRKLQLRCVKTGIRVKNFFNDIPEFKEALKFAKRIFPEVTEWEDNIR